MTGLEHAEGARAKAATDVSASDLRPPRDVMRLARMGAFFPTRLSFMRTLIRRMAAEGAVPHVTHQKLDDDGFGDVVLTVRLGGDAYSLCCFSRALDDAARSDRVIAEAWDAAFVLFDGVPGADDLAIMARQAPLQEAGRFLPRHLVLSRANRSVRFFSHVVDRLAAGLQPDADDVRRVGYLMRTTAVYGNGKFGIADRSALADRLALAGSFQAEMLTVYLIRQFTHLLVEHIARVRAPKAAVTLAPAIKRHIGIGNATGLGMAPFLVSHPVLLHNWMVARETALARVRALETASEEEITHFQSLMVRAARHLAEWNVDDVVQSARIKVLRSELADIRAIVDDAWFADPRPWDRFIHLADRRSLELQELAVALVIEPHGGLVDGLADCMLAVDDAVIRPAMRVSALQRILTENYDWALAINLDDPSSDARFWYVSAEKLEPRIGRRRDEPGAEKEMPHGIAMAVQSLDAALRAQGHEADITVAEFLLAWPELRNIVRRVQVTAERLYAEIRDNLVADTCRPIDLLRCKLSFFGASKFDPKSDLWTRITLFQGAPCPESLGDDDADDWFAPSMPDV